MLQSPRESKKTAWCLKDIIKFTFFLLPLLVFIFFLVAPSSSSILWNSLRQLKADGKKEEMGKKIKRVKKSLKRMMGKRNRQVCYVNTSTKIWNRKWYPVPTGSWWGVWNGELCLWKARFQKDKGGEKLLKGIPFFLLVCGFSGMAVISFPFRSC